MNVEDGQELGDLQQVLDPLIKTVKVSTPTTRDGYIFREYDRSDKRKYYVPCPHCGKYQVFVFGDGAAAVVVMSEAKAKELGVQPLARFVTYAVAGVPPGIMGIGPVAAIPKALKQAGLKIEDMDIIELNEAFACQALSVIRQCPLPRERVNVNGGAVALGHPLGATGAKLTVSNLHELQRRNGRYGLVTMCVGGGMGGAGVFELCR